MGLQNDLAAVAITNERLAAARSFSILNCCESMGLCGWLAVWRSVGTAGRVIEPITHWSNYQWSVSDGSLLDINIDFLGVGDVFTYAVKIVVEIGGLTVAIPNTGCAGKILATLFTLYFILDARQKRFYPLGADSAVALSFLLSSRFVVIQKRYGLSGMRTACRIWTDSNTLCARFLYSVCRALTSAHRFGVTYVYSDIYIYIYIYIVIRSRN